jgi:hypothetical protein
MRERTVKIFHCDYCRKQLRRRGAMEKHESRCIYNENRTCGFCEFAKQQNGEPLHRRLLKTLVVVLWEHDLDRLKKEANGCPGCILAAIVQQRVEAQKNGLLEEIEHIDKDMFDFDKAKMEFFDDYNREREGRY